MSAVLIALIVAAPQPRIALGVELLLLAGTLALGMLILARRAGHATAKSGTTRYLERWSPNLITPLLIGVGGVSLLVHAGAVFTGCSRRGRGSVGRSRQRLAVPGEITV